MNKLIGTDNKIVFILYLVEKSFFYLWLIFKRKYKGTAKIYVTKFMINNPIMLSKKDLCIKSKIIECY